MHANRAPCTPGSGLDDRDDIIPFPSMASLPSCLPSHSPTCFIVLAGPEPHLPRRQRKSLCRGLSLTVNSCPPAQTRRLAVGKLPFAHAAVAARDHNLNARRTCTRALLHTRATTTANESEPARGLRARACRAPHTAPPPHRPRPKRAQAGSYHHHPCGELLHAGDAAASEIPTPSERAPLPSTRTKPGSSPWVSKFQLSCP